MAPSCGQPLLSSAVRISRSRPLWKEPCVIDGCKSSSACVALPSRGMRSDSSNADLHRRAPLRRERRARRRRAAIQRAIDACAATDSGAVVFPPGSTRRARSARESRADRIRAGATVYRRGQARVPGEALFTARTRTALEARHARQPDHRQVARERHRGHVHPAEPAPDAGGGKSLRRRSRPGLGRAPRAARALQGRRDPRLAPALAELERACGATSAS
jgi:hypothetical protein